MPEAEFKVVYVFFASPGDLPEEREVAREVVEQLNQGLATNEWRIEPIFWEDKGPTYGRPQDEMNKWLDCCHIFVGMLWGRWGTPTGDFTSGFEEEFERVISRRARTGEPKIWIYLKNVDPGQLHDPGPELQKVLAFKERVESEEVVFYRPFVSPDEWRASLHPKLVEEVTSRMAASAPSGEQTVGQGEDLQTPQPSVLVEEPERVATGQQELSPVNGEKPEPETDFERPWADALLSRALAQAGIEERIEQVERLRERDPKQAGDLLEEIADALESSHPVIAEHYREQAVAAYLSGNANEQAGDALIKVARSRIERAASSAPQTARRLAASNAPVMGPRAVALRVEQRWVGEGLLARADWPEHLPEALDALRTAAAEAVEAEDEAEWAAALVELLLIAGRNGEVIERTASIRRRRPLEWGYRIGLELDVLQAEQEVKGPTATEAHWEQLCAWAEEQAEAEPARVARIWQRRGAVLAAREDFRAARSAFLRAAEIWSLAEGHDDQVAEAFFSEQVVGQMAGNLRPVGSELRPIAASLRGSVETASARADRLEHDGLNHRVAGKLFEARRSFWLAYAEHRRAGNLRGQFAVMEHIADLYDEARRPVEAVAAYVLCAREDNAGKAGRKVKRADDVLPVLTFSTPKWERAASFAVLAAVGRRLSTQAVAPCVPTLLAEAEKQPTSFLSPQPVLRARQALAAVALSLPDDQRARGLDLLRALALGGYIGTARPAAEALILLTNAGRSDETVTVTQAFLADSGISGVNSIWVGERLATNAESREAVRIAALEGRSQALEAAAVGNLPATDPELAETCRRYIEGVISVPTVRVEETQRSVDIVSFEGSGIIARSCTAELRRRFVSHMLEVADSTDDPESNRASAAHALFNVALALTPDELPAVVDSLLPLALGEYSESEWEGGPSREEDPFVRFDLSFGTKGPLRSAALEALGALAGRLDDVEPRFEIAVRDALWFGEDELVAAAYEALARATYLELPGPLESAFTNRAHQVRLGALRCWFARGREVPRGVLLDRLLRDDAVMVRILLLSLAAEAGSAGRDVLERLLIDEDAYVRALAARELEQPTRETPRLGRGRPPTP